MTTTTTNQMEKANNNISHTSTHPTHPSADRPGYKHTALGWIPEDWDVKQCGQIFKLSSGSTKPNQLSLSITEKFKYPVYGGNGIIGFAHVFNNQTNAIIIGRVGENCGVTRFIEGKCWVTDNALISKNVIEGVDLKFLAYKLINEDLAKLRNKGGQPLISQGPIAIHKIAIPKDISQQTAIAKLLSTWDEAISKLQALIDAKTTRKKWLMQQLLTGKKRLPGFEGDVTFQHLKEFITEVSEKGRNVSIKKVLSVTNSRGFIKQSEQFDREIASEDRSNYKIVRKGQFAYNPSRVNVGSLDLLRNFDDGILSPMYVVFETDSNRLLPEFLYYHLKSNWFNCHIPMYVQGSVRDSLSFDGLKAMRFFIPAVEEQISIANVLQSADKEIALVQNQLENLKEQKKGLMQQLLTGKKRLSTTK